MARNVKQRRRRRGVTRVSAKNQITIPVDALAKSGVSPGDMLLVEVKRTGEIVLRRESDPLKDYYGSMTGLFPPDYVSTLRDEWD